MFDLRTKLLDLDEDLERLTWGVQAARAVSAAISQDHSYGEGLYAVSDYLYEVQEKMRGALDLCLAQVREGQYQRAGQAPAPAHLLTAVHFE